MTPEIRSDFLAFGRPSFGDEEIDAVTRAIRSGWVGMGPEVIQFERELSAFCGAKHLVSVNSCTSALQLALLVSGIGADDEVICPSLTWCSTANAALYLRAKPVVCDVDPQTLSVTADTIRARITQKTKAVIVVHMGGLAADVHYLRSVLPRHIAIIEDAAHALGATYPDGSPVGSSGNLTCFSFYANKNLSTGEGGAIALNDADVAARLKSLRQHGLSTDAWKRFIEPQKALTPDALELGFKMNYTDLQAALGRVQLRRQPEFRKLRSSIAARYYDRLRYSMPGLEFQTGFSSVGHARHLLLVKLPVENMEITRDNLVLQLRARNIGASIHYRPLHMMPLYKCNDDDLPATSSIWPRLMTLPISASMSFDDVDYVTSHLLEIAAGKDGKC